MNLLVIIFIEIVLLLMLFKEKLQQLEQSRLFSECNKLDPSKEKALAEEGMAEELVKWSDLNEVKNELRY